MEQLSALHRRIFTQDTALRNEGATWSSYIHSVEDVLQASSNLPHNARRSKIGGLARVRDGCGETVMDLPDGLALDLCCRRSPLPNPTDRAPKS